MEANRLLTLLKELNLEVTNTEFPPGFAPKPPFIVFLNTDIDTFIADDSVYLDESRYSIELYTPHNRDFKLEKKLKDLFNKEKIIWSFNSSIRLDNGVYLTVYTI